MSLNFTDDTIGFDKINIAGFWIIVTGIAATGLAWMQNLARTTGNQALASAANSFLILFFISIIVELMIFIFHKHKFWGDREEGSSLGISFLFFYLFGAGWLLLTRLSNMTILSQNTILSQAGSSLTEFQAVFFNVFMAPTIEENFFRIALPILIFLLIRGVFNSFDVEQGGISKIVEFAVAVVGSTAAFVVFHTGQIGNTSFSIQAAVFGGILSFVLLADIFFNTFEFITIVPAGLVGIHMVNNAAQYGIFNVINILMGETLGLVILAFMGIGFLSALNEVSKYLGLRE